MDARTLTKLRKDLTSFLDDAVGTFGHPRRRRWCDAYLRGVLLDGHRKSVEPMAARLKTIEQGDEVYEQALQQFLNQSPWDEQTVLDSLHAWIVQRPRKKGCTWTKPKGYWRQLRRYGEDGPPAREGIKACWQGRLKYLNEHLGPLRRYLDKQVGRPWNKVFSEICAHISRNSAVQDHVRDHVAD